VEQKLLRLWLVGYQCVQARAIAAIWRSADTQTAPIGVPWAGDPMTAPVTASETDLRTLAGIISDHRQDLPAAGLPLSLLADLKNQIRCDKVQVAGVDSNRQADWFEQDSRPIDAFTPRTDDLERAYWEQYWDCKLCSYPDRTGDLRTIVKIADFYSARQWHSTGMYCEYYRPLGGSMSSSCACPKRRGEPPGPGGLCGSTLSAGLARTSPSATGRCSRCCARTCTRPTWTPNAAVIPAPRSPRGTGTC
jgi:hypothetical protein